MAVKKVKAGKNPPHDINVVIEIPGGSSGGSPIKYEIDHESGAIVVDRIISTPMFYPCNYGFVPHTLCEDGDPVDVLVHAGFDLLPSVVIACRPIGVLKMSDDGGEGDDKIIAVPVSKVDPFQSAIKSIEDLPEIMRGRIQHFFERYKDLEPGKWSKIKGWGSREEAENIILAALKKYSS